MKHWKLFNIGDEVKITHSTQKEDIGKVGTITLVRNSFCKIEVDGKERNYTYAQFKMND